METLAKAIGAHDDKEQLEGGSDVYPIPDTLGSCSTWRCGPRGRGGSDGAA
jgi:hypothetical protein